MSAAVLTVLRVAVDEAKLKQVADVLGIPEVHGKKLLTHEFHIVAKHVPATRASAAATGRPEGKRAMKRKPRGRRPA